MKEILFQYNPWWESGFSHAPIVDRPKYTAMLSSYLENKSIVFLTGLRRVGKTTLMKRTLQTLLDAGVPRYHVLYVSVDDYLLKDKNIFEIVDVYRQIHRIEFDQKIYLFFDEITYQIDFHQQLKNLYDKMNCKVFATSSSSSLLKDKKAFLTGRAIVLEIMPLDFSEYKQFKGVVLKQRDNSLNDTYFRDYMRDGGLPENVLHPNREYLMTLVDDIIQKDITAFHGLKNHYLMRDYYTLLMERSGKPFSINKIANILKISPDTARRYLSYFEESYLIHLLPRWGKTNESLLSAKKIYACDLGIKYLFVGDRDLGSYFENYVYLKLRNNKDVYYYYDEGHEIDFYTADKILIECKYNGELKADQHALFDRIEANQKLIIDSVSQLTALDEIVMGPHESLSLGCGD